MKEPQNNRPRVEWKNGKPTVSATEKKKVTKRPQTRTRTAAASTKKVQKPPQKVERVYENNNANNNENDIIDFFLSLKHKRHIVVAFIVILALSIIVASIVVSVADGDYLDPPADDIDTNNIKVDAVVPIENDGALPVVDKIEHEGHGHAVCIDPGHGYDDVGTSNPELEVYENEVVLRVSLRLRDMLEDQGVKVYMTHDTNTPPPESDKNKQYLLGMKKRTSFANSFSDVSLYISIHCDAFYEDVSVNGSRVFYMAKEADSESVANAVAQALIDAGSEKEPVVKSMSGMDSYQVLRDTSMAAVLVETGFVSNEAEAKNMLTDEWVEYMAGALADAIMKSFENKVI